ncbi:hypothetical protein EWM64_g996 [Hericium alpestre]|uniref:Uncharacterized protein n=1 Tax=Hericium alpestre TaxID=135208 RepID=A0A4Z0A9P1_9AGAM|nr:hypothetical protein EWM64_g996 [Hericium alpestre]
MPRKSTPEMSNDTQQSAGAGNSNSQRPKRPSPLAQQPIERAPKRRALAQVNSSSGLAREPGSSSQGSRVKQEDDTADPAQAEVIRTLQESIQAAHDTMLAAQAQLDRLENRQVKASALLRPYVSAQHMAR